MFVDELFAEADHVLGLGIIEADMADMRNDALDAQGKNGCGSGCHGNRVAGGLVDGDVGGLRR